MKLAQLTPEEAAALATRTLGFEADTIDLSWPEGIAASLRRAASFMCPTSPARLVDAVLGALRPVSGDATPPREEVADLLDLLVATGDLLELRHDSGRSTRLLYLGPPSFIEREAKTYVLMGVRPYGAPLLDEDGMAAIEHEGHTRLLRWADGVADLKALGLHSVARDTWIASPRRESHTVLLDRLRSRLDVVPDPGPIDGLQVLDPMKTPRFYRGRWRPASNEDTGDLVARRPQAYGADLWCLVRLKDGVPRRMLEFPIEDPVVPGRDEAWRAQAAIDAMADRPQRYRIRPADGAKTDVAFDFFSPLPGFAERYLQLVGLALGRTHGALFSFRVPHGERAGVATLLTDMLWMEQEEASR